MARFKLRAPRRFRKMRARFKRWRSRPRRGMRSRFRSYRTKWKGYSRRRKAATILGLSMPMFFGLIAAVWYFFLRKKPVG